MVEAPALLANLKVITRAEDITKVLKEEGDSREDHVKLAFKILTIFSLTMVIGGYTDAWWHVHVGRESFWIPPHLVIYSSLIVILLAFTYLYFNVNMGRSKYGVIIGFLMLLSAAPIDDWWHTFNPPEVGLALMSPPHMYFAIGGAIAGLHILRIVAEQTGKYGELRKYLFIHFLAGYLMSMQAIGLIDPSNPTLLGYLGSALFAAVPTGFYIFARRTFSSQLLLILGLGEGLAKTLLESSLLYLLPLVLSALFVTKVLNRTGQHRSPLVYGAGVGIILGSYLLFFFDSLGPTTISIRFGIAILSAALVGIVAIRCSDIFSREYQAKTEA